METTVLSYKEIRKWAGWIPVKFSMLILIAIFGAVGVLDSAVSINLNASMFVISLLSLFILMVPFIWHWGSNKRKFQIEYLKETIDSHKRSLSVYLKMDKYRKQIEWHERRLNSAQRILRKLLQNEQYSLPQN